MTTCLNLLVLIVGLLLNDSIVHKLNTVQNEISHLWKTSAAC